MRRLRQRQLTQLRELDPSRPYVGCEYGVGSEIFAERGSVMLRGPVDKLGLFMLLFAHAEAIAEQGRAASKKNAEVIESSVKAMGAL